MAKKKSQKEMQKELYKWYKKTMTIKDMSWSDVTNILIDYYRLSDVKSERAIYDMFIEIEEELLKEIRWELDETYKGEPLL